MAIADATQGAASALDGQASGLARALGWFSLGLGCAEAIAPQRTARLIGVEGFETLLRSFGLREIASGLGLVAARNPGSGWLWARAGGDAMDLALLGAAALSGRARPGRIAAAAAAVAGVAALDVVCAQALRRQRAG